MSGCIAEGLVSDSESARAGQVLARINDRDLRAALGRAQAEGEAAEASVCNLNAQITCSDRLSS